jgi:hypothetical protein
MLPELEILDDDATAFELELEDGGSDDWLLLDPTEEVAEVLSLKDCDVDIRLEL